MFRQDIAEIKDFSLGGVLNYGTEACAISCVLEIVEQERPVMITIDFVKRILDTALNLGFIDREFTILGVRGWEGVFYLAGLSVECRYEKDPNYQCKDNEREALKLVKPGHTHFVPGNGKGCYSWDSLGHRPQQKDYRIAEKRIFKVNGVV